MTDIHQTDYERDQSFNSVVSWLHSFRYRMVIALFDSIAAERPGEPIRVVEIGSAHGKLFSILNDRFDIEYTGVEIDEAFVDTARARYGEHVNFSVVHESATTALSHLANADIVVALEALEHIPEREVVRIIEGAAAARPKLFVCSVPVEIGPAIWLKNVGSFLSGYMRHKEYRWIETWWAGVYRLDKLPAHGVRHKGFDWRWLAQTIHHNMEIDTIRRFPVRWLPSAFAFSVFIVAKPFGGQGVSAPVDGTEALRHLDSHN